MKKKTDRKNITEFLSHLLVTERFGGNFGKYWASEVVLDYGLKNPKRVDFMQFKPVNQYSVSGLEKGIFICYEIKSCKEDYHSGNGLNFEGEKNYIVTTMECYKSIINEIPFNVGVIVAMPFSASDEDEFKSPTEIPDISGLNYNERSEVLMHWKLRVINPAHPVNRTRSIIELLFCMLRAQNKNIYKETSDDCKSEE